MKKIVDGKEVEMNEEEIQALEQSRFQQWDRKFSLSMLSLHFDEKFKTYWSEKGYENLTDLISHEANPNSIYHAEALSLVQWSHEQWEIAAAQLNENSDIEQIINSLQEYNG